MIQQAANLQMPAADSIPPEVVVEDAELTEVARGAGAAVNGAHII